jgi:nucleotide-binding universal stress UspA family protein
MPIEQIFVPIDFSDYSERAVALGLDMARAFGARLHVFHCFEELTGGKKAPVGSVGLDPAIRAKAEEDLAQLVGRFDSQGVEVDLECHPGMYPAEIVLETVEKTAPDLIVLGTHGHSGIKHALFGSLTEEIVRKARCPVVTVKAP